MCSGSGGWHLSLYGVNNFIIWDDWIYIIIYISYIEGICHYITNNMSVQEDSRIPASWCLFSIQVFGSFFADWLFSLFPLLPVTIPRGFPYMARFLAMSLLIYWTLTCVSFGCDWCFWEDFSFSMRSFSKRLIRFSSRKYLYKRYKEELWKINNHWGQYRQYQDFPGVSGQVSPEEAPPENFFLRNRDWGKWLPRMEDFSPMKNIWSLHQTWIKFSFLGKASK